MYVYTCICVIGIHMHDIFNTDLILFSKTIGVATDTIVTVIITSTHMFQPIIFTSLSKSKN